MNLYVIQSRATKKYFVVFNDVQMRLIWSDKSSEAKEWYTRQAAKDAFQDVLSTIMMPVNMDEYYEVVPVKYTCKVRDLSDYNYRGGNE